MILQPGITYIISIILSTFSSATVIRKAFHRDGYKEFLIVKEIKKNRCVCPCTCHPIVEEEYSPLTQINSTFMGETSENSKGSTEQSSETLILHGDPSGTAKDMTTSTADLIAESPSLSQFGNHSQNYHGINASISNTASSDSLAKNTEYSSSSTSSDHLIGWKESNWHDDSNSGLTEMSELKTTLGIAIAITASNVSNNESTLNLSNDETITSNNVMESTDVLSITKSGFESESISRDIESVSDMLKSQQTTSTSEDIQQWDHNTQATTDSSREKEESLESEVSITSNAKNPEGTSTKSAPNIQAETHGKVDNSQDISIQSIVDLNKLFTNVSGNVFVNLNLNQQVLRIPDAWLEPFDKLRRLLKLHQEAYSRDQSATENNGTGYQLYLVKIFTNNNDIASDLADELISLENSSNIDVKSTNESSASRNVPVKSIETENDNHSVPTGQNFSFSSGTVEVPTSLKSSLGNELQTRTTNGSRRLDVDSTTRVYNEILNNGFELLGNATSTENIASLAENKTEPNKKIEIDDGELKRQRMHTSSGSTLPTISEFHSTINLIINGSEMRLENETATTLERQPSEEANKYLSRTEGITGLTEVETEITDYEWKTSTKSNETDTESTSSVWGSRITDDKSSTDFTSGPISQLDWMIDIQNLRQKMKAEWEIAKLLHPEWREEEESSIQVQENPANIDSNEFKPSTLTKKSEETVHDILQSVRTLKEWRKDDNLKEKEAVNAEMERRERMNKEMELLNIKNEENDRTKDGTEISNGNGDITSRAAVQDSLRAGVSNENLNGNRQANINNQESSPPSAVATLSPAQCEAIKKFTQLYNMPNPSEFVRMNCHFVREYFPRASCRYIAQLFDSCT